MQLPDKLAEVEKHLTEADRLANEYAATAMTGLNTYDLQTELARRTRFTISLRRLRGMLTGFAPHLKLAPPNAPDELTRLPTAIINPSALS